MRKLEQGPWYVRLSDAGIGLLQQKRQPLGFVSPAKHLLSGGGGYVVLGSFTLGALGQCSPAPAPAAGIRCGSVRRERHELLWEGFFLHPARLWDRRPDKRRPRHPDFRHKATKEPLWLNSPQKPGWLDGELARWDAALEGHCAGADEGSGSAATKGSVKCEDLPDAACRPSRRNIFSWTATISAHMKRGRYRDALISYKEMRGDSFQPSKYLLLSLMKVCARLAELEEGKSIHAEAVEFGHGSDLIVGTTLVDMYAKCGSMMDAERVFDTLTERDVVAWNAMISGYSQQEQGKKALQLYSQMQDGSVRPNERTFVSALKSCGCLAASEQEMFVSGQYVKADSLARGREIHAQVVKQGCELGLFVGTTLVDMYAKCGSMSDAHNVFDRLPQRDVVSWSAMIGGYAQQGQGGKALLLYSQMLEVGIKPDNWTFVSVLKACACLAAIEEETFMGRESARLDCLAKAKLVHAEVVRRGFGRDLFICNSLIHLYGKCGSMVDAEQVFNKIQHPNVVSWTAMIEGYAEQNQVDKAMELYSRMKGQGVQPDQAAFLSILKVCSNVGALDTCMQIHQDIIDSEVDWSVNAASNLVHAYSKCGSIVKARCVFDNLPKQHPVLWNSMIAAYARHGDCASSSQCFLDMQKAGVDPDGITFISLLAACSHAGLVEEGLAFFHSMSNLYSITPTARHYACLVDLLSRAGLLVDAENVLLTMPTEPDVTMWLSLLGACRTYQNVELGRRAFDGVVKLDPKYGAAYVVMSSMYSLAQRWEDATKIQELRLSERAWKTTGQSWTEHLGTMHVFVVGDTRHPQIEEIHAKIRHLNLQEASRHLESAL